MASIIVDNRKITGGIITMSGVDANTYYCREINDTFVVNNTFNGTESIFDWVVTKSTDSRYIKSGVTRITANKKTLVIPFDTAFPSAEYFLFFSPNKNINTYWCDKRSNRFVISGSSYIGEEVSWLAIHKDFAVKTGIANPGTIYCGQRIIKGAIEEEPSMSASADVNGSNWQNCQYIIEPETTGADGFIQPMDLENYSIIVSSNVNINTFWIEKDTERVKIGTSLSKPCIIDFLIIETGVDWWNEF